MKLHEDLIFNIYIGSHLYSQRAITTAPCHTQTFFCKPFVKLNLLECVCTAVWKLNLVVQSPYSSSSDVYVHFRVWNQSHIHSRTSLYFKYDIHLFQSLLILDKLQQIRWPPDKILPKLFAVFFLRFPSTLLPFKTQMRLRWQIRLIKAVSCYDYDLMRHESRPAWNWKGKNWSYLSW